MATEKCDSVSVGQNPRDIVQLQNKINMEKLELKLLDPGKQGKAEKVLAGFHLSEDVGEKIYKVFVQIIYKTNDF